MPSPTSGPILVVVSHPERQRRLTIAFRMLLAIPHLIVLNVLGIAAAVLLILGWFGALFTGQLPDFAASFLTGYLRWYTSVYGYIFLLTDQYPPFSLEDSGYPIRLAAGPGPLRRLAVLFRYLLTIPAWIVSAVAITGCSVLLLPFWLIALVTGRLPGSIHQALAAVLRYQARLNGYAWMLTGSYPRGLYGDPAPEAATADAATADAATADAATADAITTDTATTDAITTDTATTDTMATETTMWDGTGSGVAGSVTPVRSEMYLSRGAKRMVSALLALGVAGMAGYVFLLVNSGVFTVKTGERAVAMNAILELSHDYNQAGAAAKAFSSTTTSCNQQLSCYQHADKTLAKAIDQLRSRLLDISFPANVEPGVANLAMACGTFSTDLRAAASASTASQYNQAIGKFQAGGQALDAGYRQLIHDLAADGG